MGKIILLSDTNLTDIKPVKYGEEKCSSYKEPYPILRDYYVFHYIYSGTGTYRANNQIYQVTKGQMFIIHPHETVYHHPDHGDPWHHSWISFNINFDIPLLQTSYVLNAKNIEHIFRAVNASDTITQGREYYICGKIFELISTFIHPEDLEINKNTAFINTAVDYIKTNYRRPITIGQAAENLNVSRSYFSAVFNKELGISPHKYLTDIRLDKAAELITTYGYNVSMAAIASGYNDIFNFSKAFKKKYGVPPSMYTGNIVQDTQS